MNLDQYDMVQSLRDDGYIVYVLTPEQLQFLDEEGKIALQLVLHKHASIFLEAELYARANQEN